MADAAPTAPTAATIDVSISWPRALVELVVICIFGALCWHQSRAPGELLSVLLVLGIQRTLSGPATQAQGQG